MREKLNLYRRTAVVHLTQNLSPSIFPAFVHLQVPSITTLHFRETEQDSGLLKIYRQEDSWTLEGSHDKTVAFVKNAADQPII